MGYSRPARGGGLGVLSCGAPMFKNVIAPDVGVTSAPIMLRIVDFPQPEGPTIATNSLS